MDQLTFCIQGSTVHSIKKYHRNMNLAVDDERIANTLPYINKTDEFWDYERQVCVIYLWLCRINFDIGS